VPLSGAAEGEFTGDLRFWIPGQAARSLGEVKSRAGGEGWKTIKEWLGYNDVLFLKEDKMDPLVVLPWAGFIELLSNLLTLRNSLISHGVGNPYQGNGFLSTPKPPPTAT
jgi:hypothetical protein